MDHGLLHAIFVSGRFFVCFGFAFFFFLATEKTATEELSTALHFCNMHAILKLKSFWRLVHSIAAPL